jgi:hypothetical protein
VNETDVKELFASVAAQPAADTIDMDAVLRGGRRRHRTRVAATLGVSLGALAVVGVLLTGVLPGNAPTPVGPTPTPTATASKATGVVTSAEQLVGTWFLAPPSGPYPHWDAAWVVFDADGTWQVSGANCLPRRGTFTVTADGRFAAEEVGQITSVEGGACMQALPDITPAVTAAIADATDDSQTLTLRTANGAVRSVWTTLGSDAIVDPANWAACIKLAKALGDAGIDVWGFGPSRDFTGIELMGPELSTNPNVQARARQIAKDEIGDKYTITFIPNERPVLY